MKIQNHDMYNQSYHQASHQVTDCAHRKTEVPQKKQGALGYQSSRVNNGQPLSVQDVNAENITSPFSVFGNLLEKGKSLWLRIWGTSQEPFDKTLSAETEKLSENIKQNGDFTGAASLLPRENGIKTTEQGQRDGQVNPYFVVQEEEKPKGVFKRFRMTVEIATGFLAKKFPFAQTGSFQAKKEQNKEDLRKKSKYRKDDIQIDCILTDDSYLMDSYNKKGEYSKISTDK